jgi:hypothetical protein
MHSTNDEWLQAGGVWLVVTKNCCAVTKRNKNLLIYPVDTVAKMFYQSNSCSHEVASGKKKICDFAEKIMVAAETVMPPIFPHNSNDNHAKSKGTIVEA